MTVTKDSSNAIADSHSLTAIRSLRANSELSTDHCADARTPPARRGRARCQWLRYRWAGGLLPPPYATLAR
eukprot:3259540-Prymnesium_polylepis.1